MAADTEIRHDTINGRDPVQAKEALQVAKILRNEQDTFISGFPISQCCQILSGIIILVKSDQFTFRSQLLKDGFGMSTATKCAVDINTGFLNIQCRYCFLKQYRYMIVDGLIG